MIKFLSLSIVILISSCANNIDKKLPNVTQLRKCGYYKADLTNYENKFFGSLSAASFTLKLKFHSSLDYIQKYKLQSKIDTFKKKGAFCFLGFIVKENEIKFMAVKDIESGVSK